MFILTFVANVVVTLISLAVLPSRVAIHYGANGMANGWAPNYVNALLMTGTHVLLFCSIYLSSRFMFAYQRMINLPNKGYWLAPERRQATLEYLSAWMLWFGAATLCLLLAITGMVLRANLIREHRLPGWSWMIVAAYLAFAGIRLAMMLMRFYKVETDRR